MLSYILSFFGKSRVQSEAPLDLDEAYSVISECQDVSTDKEEKSDEGIGDIGDYEVSNRVGKVSHVFADQYRVDGLYDFKTNAPDIGVGTKISYQLIKSDGDVRVVDVHVIENDWNVAETGTRSWHERTLICNVAKREGRNLTLMPGDISINLNDVCCEFVPIPGDWVELDVKCESDENVVDCSGKIVEINKLQPVRPQVKLGQVNLWDSHADRGLVDKNIFFNRDSLYCGYIPVKGDRVVVEIIESNQGTCVWRAVRIIPDYLHRQENNKQKNNQKIEDCYDNHEHVTITNNISLTFTKLGESKLFLVEVESQEEVQLVSVEVPQISGQCKLSTAIDHQVIPAKRSLSVRFECKAKILGETRELLIFHFEQIKIKRWVTINVAMNSCTKVKEKPVQPQYVSRTKRELIRGQKMSAAPRFISLQMPEFLVPERLLNLLTTHKTEASTQHSVKTELEKMKPCLVSTLSYMNFEDKFHTLLHLEECEVLLSVRCYDRERVCFVRNAEFLLLEVENLAEKRPSIIPGDRIIARSVKDPNSPDYEGFVHKIAKNHVYIKFSQIFHDSYDGEDYSVYVVASRTTFRRKHYGIKLAVKNLGRDWLFPTKVAEKEPQLEFVFDSYTDIFNDSNTADGSEMTKFKSPTVKEQLLEKIRQFNENPNEVLPVRKLEWHNNALNFYQKEAVKNVLMGVCRPFPYIIFGPPGTGKTVTLVETVLQILRMMPHSRILLCAPSNSAADLLALRLIDSGVLKPGDLIRLVAWTAVASIPEKLAPYCATGNIERGGTETSLPVVTPNGLVLGYSSSVLGRHRITVCTCSSAGLLYSMGFAKGHFSHIIVDEAGQTSEPSVLVPLAFLDVSSGQAILAGDPMQLGPVMMSRFASDYGLAESLLERFINRSPYLKDTYGFPKSFGYNPRLITKLIYNYRSLPALLKLPSVLFYNDELQATISEEGSRESDILQQLQTILPKTKDDKIASLVFHGILGENFQNEESPSWYNPSEASQVFYYVNEFYRLGLTSKDIGIITPYKAQCKQLVDLFREAEFDIPKTGTVEEFQGQEFNVIILSTVRSSKKYLASDIKFSMGFISNPRRVNVAITRAKALLIIVGNPELLITERSWRSVVNYCTDKGGVVGAMKSR